MNVEVNSDVSWMSLILISLAVFIITLDTTFMNVALSQIVSDLNTTLSTVQAIMSFYTLITASLMLLGARLQDVWGKKKVFLVGCAIYGAGTLIAGFSQNTIMLFVGWAVLEGVGGALMTPATVSITSETYTGNKRTLALSIVSVMASIGAGLGPLIGGIVVSSLSWRFGFLLELLIVAIIFIFSNKIKHFQPTLSMKDLDWKGSIILILGLVCLVGGVLLLEDYMMFTLPLLILSAIILLLFVKYENKIKELGKTPILDISMLKVGNLSNGTIARLLTTLAMTGVLFAVSVFLQSTLALDALTTGIYILPETIGMLIVSIIAPKLTVKFNHKILMIIGFIISIISSLMLSTSFGVHTTFMSIAPGMFLMGVGIGLVISLNTDITLRGTKDENQNTASGVVNTGHSLGSSLGTAIIGCILIVGATWGLHDAAYSISPNNIDHVQLESNSKDYLESLEQGTNVSELKNETSIKEQIVDKVLSDEMKIVMYSAIIVLLMGLLFTLRLNDKKLKSSKKNKGETIIRKQRMK